MHTWFEQKKSIKKNVTTNIACKFNPTMKEKLVNKSIYLEIEVILGLASLKGKKNG